MGLADRDYMKRQGPNDPYYKRLFDPPGIARTSPVTGKRSHRGGVGWLVIAALTIFGLWVLPHLTIHGHHYRFWMI